MRQEEFTYDSRDNETKIHAYRFLPDEGEPIMVVQLIHGMAEHAKRYIPFAEFLTSRGCVVVINEHLGHGDSVKEGNPLGYFCTQDPATVVVRDVHRLKKMTQSQYPTLPYVIFGHSMGSYILRNYLTMYGSGIQAAVLCAPGYQEKGMLTASKILIGLQGLLLTDKHVGKMLDKIAFGKHNQRITDAKTSFDWLSRDPAVVEKYVQDDKCGFVFTVNGFRTLADLSERAIDGERLAKIPKELPILIISGKEDPVGDYGQAVPKIVKDYEDVGLKEVSVQFFDQARHELLNEPEKDSVMAYVHNWIQEKVKDGK